MKKIHIILILVIAVSFGVVLTSLSNNSTYASFKEATEHGDRIYHVVGTLDKSKPFLYDPHLNANLFTFYLKDREGTERKVTLDKPEPEDFEKSDKIVVIGSAINGTEFHAREVLMKCPSKYNDGKPTEKQVSAM